VAGAPVNRYWPGGFSTGAPTGVQLLNGSDAFVVDRTVKEAPGALVNANWKEPLASICALKSVGGAAWVTEMTWPRRVMLAVRAATLLAVIL